MPLKHEILQVFSRPSVENAQSAGNKRRTVSTFGFSPGGTNR
jgi:hypothetical protein